VRANVCRRDLLADMEGPAVKRFLHGSDSLRLFRSFLRASRRCLQAGCFDDESG
jgi:hypothetical protein